MMRPPRGADVDTPSRIRTEAKKRVGAWPVRGKLRGGAVARLSARAARGGVPRRRGRGLDVCGRRSPVRARSLRPLRGQVADRAAQAGVRARAAPDLGRHHSRSADHNGGHMIVTEDQIREEITDAIRRNRVMLFMKGTPEMPRCGFSARTVQCLDATGADYAAMDILPDARIRHARSAQSGWPTIPQLFIDGELVGGCDIVTELYQTGELAKMVAPAA